MKVNDPVIKEAVGESDPYKVFVELVRRRNKFFMKKGFFFVVCSN